MKRRLLLLGLIIASMLLTSGCWDKQEINDRMFIMIMGLEMNAAPSETPVVAGVDSSSMPKKLKVHFSVPIPGKSSGKSNSGGKSEGEETFTDIVVDATSIPDALMELGYNRSKVPMLDHLEVLLIGEQVLADKQLFLEILDFAERCPSLSQVAVVAVVKGMMNEIISVKPRLDQLPATYIHDLLMSSQNTLGVEATNVNGLLTAVSKQGDAVLPVLEMGQGDDVMVGEMALIRKFEPAGYLEREYMQSFQCIRGKLLQSRRLLNYQGVSITFRSYRTKRQFMLNDPKSLQYTVNVSLEGTLCQYDYDRELAAGEDLLKIQQQLEREMAAELGRTLTHFQRQVGYDFLGIDEYTRKYHNKLFKQHEQNWTEAFKQAQVKFNVQVTTIHLGAKN